MSPAAHAHTRVNADGTPRPAYLDRLYAGDVMARFPLTDHKSVPFPQGIAMFCIPDSIRLTSSVSALPHLHYFAATQGDGHRLYGACLQFWEAVPRHIVEELEEADRRRTQKRASMSDMTLTSAAPTCSSGDGSGDGELTQLADNPLSRVRGDDAENSMSICNYEMEHSVTKKAHSRSPSPTPGGGGGSGGGAAKPPRPGLVNLSSFQAVSVQPSAASPSFSSSTPRCGGGGGGGGGGSAAPVPSFAMASSAPSSAPSPASTTLATAVTRASSASLVITTTATTNAGALSSMHSVRKKKRPQVYAPKCICILSLHPYLGQRHRYKCSAANESVAPCWHAHLLLVCACIVCLSMQSNIACS